MLARESIRAHPAQQSFQSDAAGAAVRRALDLLSRASAEWRNGASCESGALHWPVAVTLARSELRKALEALAGREGGRPNCERAGSVSLSQYCPGDWLEASDTDNARAGLAWYNSATIAERRYWHQVARSAVPADAWEAYKAGGPQP